MVKTQNTIQMFLDLLLNPSSIISRLPIDVQIAVSKRGTLKAWAEDGTIQSGPNVPKPQKKKKRTQSNKPNTMDVVIWAIKEIPAEQLTLAQLGSKTGHAHYTIKNAMRKLGYESKVQGEDKFFFMSGGTIRSDKYSKVYKFYLEILPTLALPFPRSELLILARNNGVVNTTELERDIASKCLRNMAKDKKVLLSDNKKFIVSIDFKGESIE